MIERHMAFLVLVDRDGPAGENRHIPVTLSYDKADPYAVKATFHNGTGESVVWLLSRDVLYRGLHSSAGLGDVRVWLGGEPIGGVYMRLTSPDGACIFALPPQQVGEFLEACYVLVGHGAEQVDVDGWIERAMEQQ